MRNMLLSTAAMLYAPNTETGTGDGDAPFTLKVGKKEGIGEYKPGTYTKARHVVDILRQTAMSLAKDDEEKEELRKAPSSAIMEAAQEADVTDLGKDETELDRYVQAVLDADYTVLDAANIPSMTTLPLPLEGTNAAHAITFGGYVTDDTMTDAAAIVKASIEADAGPITLMHDVERDMEGKMVGNMSFVDILPRIGSKYQPSAKNPSKAPLGYRTPGEANDPHKKDLPEWPKDRYDHYETEVMDKGVRVKRRGHWVSEFTAAKFARVYADRLDHLRAAAAGKLVDIDEKDGVQRAYRDEAKKLRDLAVNGDKSPLDQAIAECARQFQKRMRMMDTALRLIEAKHYCSTVLSHKNREVKVVLYGVKDIEEPTAEQVAEASKLRKPFCFRVTTYKMVKGVRTAKENDGATFEMSKLRNVIKRHGELGLAPGMEPADLIVPKKRAGKDPNATADAKPKVLAREIKDVGDFEDTLYATATYIGDKDKRKLLWDLLKKPSGGQLASAICTLDALIGEFAGDKAVKDRAGVWDNAQREAIAAAEKAAAA